MAMDEENAKYFFQDSPNSYIQRFEMISACVKMGDVDRAAQLVDMMAGTKEYEGYEDLNGWGRLNALTLIWLIHEYDYYEKDNWDKKDITDQMRENVKQLVYRMMPYLPQRDVDELKYGELYKIDLNCVEEEDYIARLLEDADVYTTFPKPKGKGGAPNINRMSEEFMISFKRLSRMGRLDVVVAIMRKFAAVHDVLKPVPYNTWMAVMTTDLPNEDVIRIFRESTDIFEAWLDGKSLRIVDILSVAVDIGEDCTREEFQEFRNLVISRRGHIKGLDACFEATSENTTSQILFDGQTVRIILDYMNVAGYDPVVYVDMSLITDVKSEKAYRVRLVKSECNGIETPFCGFNYDTDEELPIDVTYRVYEDEEVQNTLEFYSEIFEEYEIDEVESVALRFVILDEDDNVIEETGDLFVELDDNTGEYKVTKELTPRIKGNQDSAYAVAGTLEEGEEFGSIAAGSYSTNGIDTPLPFSREILLMTTMINGAMHVENIHSLAKALKVGDQVTLRMETMNKYDSKAILVLDPGGEKLGYIPKHRNEPLNHLMDAGKELFGIVASGDIGENLDEEDTWIEIYINIYMRD
ncbi:MAG: hypothetical protein IJ930_09605 [Lachnospiraceae bacterium]|nr:hypothetical protein [Lachnospiraceae bacterium]